MYAFDIVYAFDMVCDMVLDIIYTFDIEYSVYTIYAFPLALAYALETLLKSKMAVFIMIVNVNVKLMGM